MRVFFRAKSFGLVLASSTKLVPSHQGALRRWSRKTHTRPGITKRTYAFSVRRDKPLCLTSVKDMGSVAARCAVEGFSSDAPLDVVSDVLTPAEIAAAFGAAQGEAVRHRQAWLLYILSRALLPELHQIIRFYRTTDFGGNAARRNDLLEAFETPPKLQPFAAFLAAYPRPGSRKFLCLRQRSGTAAPL